ncbi:hypothetical protein J3R30DRAFT_3703208 [Lentinula aciculospora]|uniref:Uncharacterized protein n=1 Tax=Lentinula aciculospora TaxID=153920 RepID=A0A9W9ABI3_9AGAR|nr:hypothetical protein J3R30DRAFT_3703208 [Lentinula aciculospora]
MVLSSEAGGSSQYEPSLNQEIDGERLRNLEKTKSQRRMSWNLKLTKRAPKHSEPDGVDELACSTFQQSSSSSWKIFTRRSSSLSSIACDLSGHLLGTLSTVAQFAPTPYLGSLATITLSICNAIQSAKDNKDSLKLLATAVLNLTSTVIHTYDRLHQIPATECLSDSTPKSVSFSTDPLLNEHVVELLGTLGAIKDFVERQNSRNLLRRVVSSTSDLNIIQDYKDHLRRALEAFTLQSNLVLRETILKVSSQQEDIIDSQESVRSTLESFRQDFLRSRAPGQEIASPPILSEASEMVSSPISMNDSSENSNMVDTVVGLGGNARPHVYPSMNCSPPDSHVSHSDDRWVASSPFVQPPSTPTPQLSPPPPPLASNNPFGNVFNGPVQGNITVNNYSGDHSVISNVDNSRQENFGNVFMKSGFPSTKEMFNGSGYSRTENWGYDHQSGGDDRPYEVYHRPQPVFRGRQRREQTRDTPWNVIVTYPKPLLPAIVC